MAKDFKVEVFYFPPVGYPGEPIIDWDKRIEENLKSNSDDGYKFVDSVASDGRLMIIYSKGSE